MQQLRLLKDAISKIAGLSAMPERDRLVEIVDRLIDYTSFGEMPLNLRPLPLDDPYVGACLINEANVILGAYRKILPQEPHAEPQAILAALATIDSTAAQYAKGAIEAAYRNSLWLQPNGEKRFEDLFRVAAQIIKDATNSKRLILLSTLEPCADYESQPSCARLIHACGIETVGYGCDDTNLKGQGRVVLNDVGITVYPNLVETKAVSLNRIFYASVKLLGTETSNSLEHRLSASPTYAFIDFSRTNLNRSYSSDGRVQISFNGTEPIKRHLVPEIDAEIEKNALKYLDFLKTGPKISSDLVLLSHNLSPEQIAAVLYHYHANIKSVPSVVVTSHAVDPNHRDAAHHDTFFGAGIRYYPNAFRKFYETEQIQRDLVVSRMLGANDQFYCLAKLTRKQPDIFRSAYSTEELRKESLQRAILYQRWSGSLDDVLRELKKQANDPDLRISRLQIFFSFENTDVSKLILKLRDGQYLEKDKVLGECKVHLEIVSSKIEQEQAGRFRDVLLDQVSREALDHKIQVQRPSPYLTDVTAGGLNALISDRNWDYNFINAPLIKTLADSKDWNDRRLVGTVYKRIVEQNAKMLAPFLLDDFLGILNMDGSPDSWRKICSYLNGLHDIDEKVLDPEDISAIKGALNQTVEYLIRNVQDWNDSPQLVDVLWRFTACITRYLVPNELAKLEAFFTTFRFAYVEEFLLYESYYYCAFSREPFAAIEQLIGLLNPAPGEIGPDLLKRMLRFLAVSIKRGLLKFPEFEALIARLAPVETRHEFVSHCKGLLKWLDDKNAIGAYFRSVKSPDDSATFLSIKAMLNSFHEAGRTRRIFDDETEIVVLAHRWRGDRIGLIRAIANEVPQNEVLSFLSSIIADRDPSNQWVALNIIFGTNMVEDYYSARLQAVGIADLVGAEQADKIARAQAAKLRTGVIETLLKENAYYWLVREAVAWLIRERSQPNQVDLPGHVHPTRIPKVVWETSHNAKQAMRHEEVAGQIALLTERVAKVLFILPPLAWPERTPPSGSKLGTPPLGIGQLAAFVTDLGHYAEVLDLYHDTMTIEDVASRAGQFDIVCVSVVESTMARAIEMITVIREVERKGEKEIVVVMGGVHPTLFGATRISRQIRTIDHVVEGPGEQFFEAFLRNWPNRNLKKVSPVAAKAASFTASKAANLDYLKKKWESLRWIERDLYVDRTGNKYEPIHTRNGQDVEAHITLARGCDWKCSFCSEAVINGQTGEVRRPVKDIVAEIVLLILEHNVTRIQFIDDNILPVIANYAQPAPEADLVWARDFLASLTKLKQIFPNFGWRGLMRVEDCIKYVDAIGDFGRELKVSGCLLLAFGIETASEERRATIKYAPHRAANAQIVQTIGYLRQHEIAVKGFFILGGARATLGECLDTIAFSVSSGLDLAYFAIYKDFRGSVRRANKSKKISEFSCFEVSDSQMLSKLDRLFPQLSDSAGVKFDFAEAQSAFQELTQKGLKVTEMIKYNDFHAEADEMDTHYTLADYDGSFFDVLRLAYVAFYCRPAWLLTFERLAGRGY